jgi:hypothetical protein
MMEVVATTASRPFVEEEAGAEQAVSAAMVKVKKSFLSMFFC